jgi:hypothetical protein
MKRLSLLLIVTLGCFIATAHATTALQAGPNVNVVYQGSNAPAYEWSFVVTDLPANLLTSVPSIFTQVSSRAPVDAALIATTQSAILAKITLANTAAPNQYVTVTVSRSALDSVANYTVVTIW